jgi:hypothetical protein
MAAYPLLEKPLNTATKGLGQSPNACTLQDVASLGWNILREEVSLPVAVLRQSRIQHNLRWMQDFMQRYGVKLAPHGKTTMSPALFHLQLKHGAWGITLATAPPGTGRLAAWHPPHTAGQPTGGQGQYGHHFPPATGRPGFQLLLHCRLCRQCRCTR